MVSKGIEPQNITVTPSSRAYLEKFVEHALLEGEPGQQEITNSARPVLEALHHVLGGGTVSITVETPGDVTVVEELDMLLNNATDEYNHLPPDADLVFF